MKKLNLSLLGVVLIALFTFTACEEQTKSEKAKKEIKEAAQSVSDLFKKEGSTLKQDIEAAQKNIDKKLEKLNEKWKDASVEAKVDIENKKQKLEIKRKKLGKDLDQLGNNISNGWTAFKANVRETLNQVEEDIDTIDEDM